MFLPAEVTRGAVITGDPGFTLRTYVHLMPSSDNRMRQAVDTGFAQWETEMSDGPATAQGVRR